MRHRGAYSVLLTHDKLCKPTPIKQVVVTAIVFLSNICRAETMLLCMDSVCYQKRRVPLCCVTLRRFYKVRWYWRRFAKTSLHWFLTAPRQGKDLVYYWELRIYFAFKHNHLLFLVFFINHIIDLLSMPSFRALPFPSPATYQHISKLCWKCEIHRSQTSSHNLQTTEFIIICKWYMKWIHRS